MFKKFIEHTEKKKELLVSLNNESNHINLSMEENPILKYESSDNEDENKGNEKNKKEHIQRSKEYLDIEVEEVKNDLSILPDIQSPHKGKFEDDVYIRKS